MEKETFSAQCRFSTGDTKNTFKGMASVFNNLIDSYIPTRILPGAFAKTLTENRHRVKVLYQHNEAWPIGIPTVMREQQDGLYVEAKISDTQMGRDCITLMKDGIISELSIGFDPVRSEMVDEGAAMGMVRHISEVRLWEFSPVTFAANSEARITSVHRRPSGAIADLDRKMARLKDMQNALTIPDKLRALDRQLLDAKMRRLGRAV
ncbi:MAG: HK97 family phage prohead protease [Vicinamibacterales bacterium]